MIRLFRAPWSTNVERVGLALAHKGLEVESVVISYDDRSPVIEASGQPLVPVIDDDDGLLVADSRAILAYLEEVYPEPALFPRGPAARAQVDLFLEWFDEVWKGPPNAIETELARSEPDGDRVAELSGQMSGRLDLFERLLEGREHLLGGFSAADCAAFPFLKYARGREAADVEPFHRVLDEHQSVEGRPNLAAWIERVDARPRAY